MMAAGLIVIAHNSGGPKSDIVTTSTGDDSGAGSGRTGFLATAADEYADAMYAALTMPPDRANRIRANAQKASTRFSDEVFARSFREALLETRLLEL